MPNRSKDNTMSCILVAAYRVGNPMTMSADRIGNPIEVDAHRIGAPIEVDAHRIGAPIKVDARRIGTPMEITARLVCTINGEFYVRVSPDVIWLNPNDATVYIESNVNWLIE